VKSILFNDAKELRNGWKIAGFFVATIVIAAGLIFCRRMLPGDIRQFIPEPLLAFFGALLATWLFLRFERVPAGTRFASVGLVVSGRSCRDFGFGLGGGAFMLGLVAFVVWTCGGFDLIETQNGVAAVLAKGAWMFLGIALSEEIMFRGYAFQRAIRGMGTIGAQLVFAVLFVVVHLPNQGMSGATLVLAMLSIFLASLMFGYCYLRTNSLALPIGLHMGWNWAQSSLGFAGSGNEQHGLWVPTYNGQPEWLTGGAFGLEASIVCVIVLLLVVLGLARWRGVKGTEFRRQCDAAAAAPA
jgi:membrane protease YdiL (CAAX protease family)